MSDVRGTEDALLPLEISGTAGPTPVIWTPGIDEPRLMEILAQSAYAPSAQIAFRCVADAMGGPSQDVCPVFLCARRGASLVGFAQARIVFEDAELDYIAVHSHERGKGTGRALMSALCVSARGRGAARLLLEVGEANASARALYASIGFRELARRKKYYRGEEDALVMEKSLA